MHTPSAKLDEEEHGPADARMLVTKTMNAVTRATRRRR
jgi:hypothetical protein